jgi:hypothetical protein
MFVISVVCQLTPQALVGCHMLSEPFVIYGSIGHDTD